MSSSDGRVRVMVVDDHAVVRQGLIACLKSDAELDVVGEAASGADIGPILMRATPDVVLMDLSMPDVDGIQATRRALAARPEVRVVMLTTFSEPDQVNAALDAGAVGYVLKDADPEEIIRAVKSAARGESPFSPRAASALLERRAQRRLGDDLTPRERDVLRLIGQGLVNKQIARRLGISEKTVKAHLTSVFQTIGVSDRTAAALWAARNLK